MLPAAFIDEAVIEARGGAGGAGIVSFLRTKHQPRGGPDGGNGGRGGDVIAFTVAGRISLADYVHQRNWRAANGGRGGRSARHGANGKDLLLPLPAGTDIFDAHSQHRHASLLTEGEQCVLANGGRGGRGNISYKSATNRAPRQSTSGEMGEQRLFRFELRLLADVGLVGLPNAGKSSLVAAMSRARPAIANFAFTTLRPQLGVVRTTDYRSFVIADLPGIIAGAAKGIGLGLRFLRHISRTRLLLLVVDCSEGGLDKIVSSVRIIKNEINNTSEIDLQAKKQLLLLSKADLIPTRKGARLVSQASRELGLRTILGSSATGLGLSSLIDMLAQMVGAQ